MEYLKESWKAVVGFAALVVGQVVYQLSTPGTDGVLQALPSDLRGWLVLFGVAIVGAAGIYLKGQVPNDKQLNDNRGKVQEFLSKQGYAITRDNGPKHEAA